MNLVFYSALSLIQVLSYTFLRSFGSTPKSALLSFMPVLAVAMFQTWRSWPSGEGPRVERYVQDFFLSLGAGLVLFLSVLMFQFFIVALGAAPGGFLSELIGVLAFIAFWGAFAFVFQSQRNKAQHLGMNWTELEAPEEDPSVELEFSTMTEIEEALHLLNLDMDLDEKSLRERYHQLSLLYHPDRLGTMGETTKKVAEEEFKRIQNAHELLKIALKNNRL